MLQRTKSHLSSFRQRGVREGANSGDWNWIPETLTRTNTTWELAPLPASLSVGLCCYLLTSLYSLTDSFPLLSVLQLLLPQRPCAPTALVYT